jgi:hypothetical protein
VMFKDLRAFIRFHTPLSHWMTLGDAFPCSPSECASQLRSADLL